MQSLPITMEEKNVPLTDFCALLKHNSSDIKAHSTPPQ